MKKIFITGNHGFIGRNLCEYLQGKYQFFTPSHRELDLLDAEKVRHYIKKNQIEIIIHCANIGGARDTIGLDGITYTNLRMFNNVMRNSHLVEKIIHFGSGAEYDKSRPLKKVKEEDFDQQVPSDEYGFYKYLCSKYIEKAKNIICLRLFGVYGKYEDWRYKFISNTIVKNLFKMDLVINQNVVFDYLYIDDLVKIVHYFLGKKAKHKFYNLTPTKSITLAEICRRINSVSKYKSKIKILHEGYNNEYTGNNGRLRQEMPDLVFTGYPEGISKLYLYYNRNRRKIDKKVILKDEFLKHCKIKE